MNNTDLQVTDQVFNLEPAPRYKPLLDRFVEQLSTTGLPAHLALAQSRKDLTPIKRQIMLSSYIAGDITDVSKFLHKAVRIIGCVVYEHGPYTGLDGEEHKGYNYLLLKTDKVAIKEVTVDREVKDIKVNTVIKTSSQGVIDTFLGQVAMDRPMDFESPITVFFTGTQSTGYQVCIIEDEQVGTTIEEMVKRKRPHVNPVLRNEGYQVDLNTYNEDLQEDD
jgi:hypothetical protein